MEFQQGLPMSESQTLIGPVRRYQAGVEVAAGGDDLQGLSLKRREETWVKAERKDMSGCPGNRGASEGWNRSESKAGPRNLDGL